MRRYVVLLVSCLSVLIVAIEHSTSDIKELKCLVCTRLAEEMQKNITATDVNRKINVGGFRLDDEGNYAEKIIPYLRSDIHLTEIMESICNLMDDYVGATFKKNGKLTVIRLVSEAGEMNPMMSEVDVHDSESNKNLKYYCQSILDDNDDVFMSEFKVEHEDIVNKICVESVKICDEEVSARSRITVDEL